MAEKSKNPRLNFTEEERNTSDLKKPIRKVDKAAERADIAQDKIPKKKKARIGRTFDEVTGKSKVRLIFEESVKPVPQANLSHAIKAAPGYAVKSQIHNAISDYEGDNVGVESVHKLEEAAETGAQIVQAAHRSHKLKPYRSAAVAESRLGKANVDALYKKTLHDNPYMSSNPISRWQQKRAIRKEYAAAKSTGQAAYKTAANAQRTAKAAKKTAKEGEKTTQFIYRHRKGIGIILGVSLTLVFLANSLSSCSVMFEGGISAIAASTYPSEDSDMLAAEAAYSAMEAELQYEMDNYETIHSGYDEYHFDLDSISHDPYVLISILSALHGAFTIGDVQDSLAMLFEKQYILTETVEVETRYREEETEVPAANGETTTVTTQVPYNYYICTVELENFNLSHVPVYIMSESQLGMYATYMSVLGNRPDLFPQASYPFASGVLDYMRYEIPPEALADEVFAAMIKVAEQYLGYPYVWGGANPTTSFDCSGYVSWVINHSGWDFGRLGSDSLWAVCTPIAPSVARPGDLIFFERTYDTWGTSHVGIYVGNGMMIHCGSPISYASIETPYWQSHFYGFGRLP